MACQSLKTDFEITFFVKLGKRLMFRKPNLEPLIKRSGGEKLNVKKTSLSGDNATWTSRRAHPIDLPKSPTIQH